MLFALSILGLSVGRAFRHLLSSLGAPWLLLMVVPIVVIGAIARREEAWIPDLERRKRWSRRLVFGSLGVSILIGLMAPKPPRAPADESANETLIRIKGPSGK